MNGLTDPHGADRGALLDGRLEQGQGLGEAPGEDVGMSQARQHVRERDAQGPGQREGRLKQGNGPVQCTPPQVDTAEGVSRLGEAEGVIG